MTQDEPDHDLFPVLRAAEIAAAPVSQSWLIDDLWTRSSVGWVAGQPKLGKSWLALEMAVSVASATPCFGRFAVREPGTALIYLAEDSLPAVRERLEALSLQRRRSIDDLDVHVVTASSMRLDLARDQIRLLKTARAYAPRLLLLDPLVRLHRSDENSSAEVSSLLAYLRSLQRELDLSVLVVHHARKNGSRESQGNGLRGSSDLWAWSDSALYLKRKDGEISVTVEHRAAPAPEPFALRLVADDGPPRLEISERTQSLDSSPENLEEQILNALGEEPSLTRTALRERLSVRNERLGRMLHHLLEAGQIERTERGWTRSPTPRPDRSPFPPIEMDGNGTGYRRETIEEDSAS